MQKLFYLITKNLFCTIITISIITFIVGCDKECLLVIDIIDVGQGDSILIQTPNNKNILVDGGDENSDRTVESYLRKKHIRTIDKIIVSHPDSDHIGGIDNVIEDFNVKSVYMSRQSKEYIQKENATTDSSYSNLIKACNNKKIKINFLKKGDKLKIEDELNIQILSPTAISDEPNLNSIVFYMNYKDKKFLFTGDAEKENEEEILNTYKLEDIDFLKVGHHGSKTSSSEEFIEKLTPDISVISCGYKNVYGHPHQTTIDTLKKVKSKIYRTDEMGDLEFYSDGEKIYTKKNYDLSN
ncbi:MAG: MBL fold metallo-hydrolase [Clostridioides sp.]|jgi:competence protein ComEC|nr:MBL fold metallo-hydrolase [Clostridioides sp.]